MGKYIETVRTGDTVYKDKAGTIRWNNTNGHLSEYQAEIKWLNLQKNWHLETTNEENIEEVLRSW